MDADPDTEAELDSLAEDFVRRARSGERPRVSEFARRHPAHADRILEIFPLLTAIEDLKPEGPRPGARIGPYEVVREVGRGGMGVVYEAVHTDLGRRVALKILPVQATLDPRFLERFRREAQAAARLEHPNIVPVIGYGTQDDLHYYAMQYIQGRNLQDAVSGSTRARYEPIARIGLELAEAMAHAHAHGVLHRDVKPSNVLLDESGRAWITDFGLCRHTDADGLTRTGDILGTFRYMPPERFAGVSDARGDVYGIGITLYELLTGHQAYEGDDPVVLAARISREPPPRPRAHDPRIPSELEVIVRKAMAHAPSERYPTAEALASDLRAFLAGQPIAARSPTAGYLLRKVIGRHKPIALTVLVAALTLVASSVWYVLDLREKERRARRDQYSAHIAAVESALRAHDVQRASALLEDAPLEQRNWEWRHLLSRLEPSLRRFESVPARVGSLAYAEQGSRFAAALGREVWIYADDTGAVLQRLLPEDDPICLQWNPAGDRLAIGTFKALEIWSWPDAVRIARIEGGEHRWVTYAAGGEEIVAALVGGEVVRYEAGTGAVITRHRFDTRILALAVDDPVDTRRIALGTADGRLIVMHREDGTILWEHAVSQRGIHMVAFVDLTRVACASDGLVQVWRADTGEAIRSLALGDQVGPIVPDPTGRRLLVFCRGELHVFDLERGTLLRSLAGDARMDRAAVHPEGRRVIVGSGTGAICEWYLGVDADPLVLGRHMADVLSLDFAPGGRFLASGGFGGILRIWDVETGELARTRFGHHGAITAVRYAPGGRWLASSDDEGEILLWDETTGELARRWVAHEGAASDLAFAPGGAHLLSAGRDDVVRRWSLPDGHGHGEAALTPTGEDGDDTPRRLACSPDGRWVATTEPGGRITVRNSRDLAPVRTLSGHVRTVTGLAFHPRDILLASVSSDQTLRLWDPETGEELRGSTRHDPNLPWAAGLNAVTFNPDGSRIAAGSYAGTVRIWAAQDARLVASLDQPHWVSDLSFGPDGTRLATSLTSGYVQLWDSAPMRERAPTYERSALLRAATAPLVATLLRQAADPDRGLAALAARSDLAADTLEAARRLLHRYRGSREGLVARMERDLASSDGDGESQRVALALARGLWRSTHHREEPDARCDTLLALALNRCGQPDAALRVFERIAPRSELRAPELFAIDLAVAALSHKALDQPEQAAALLERLDTLLAVHPALRTARVEAFVAEARR